MHPKFKWIYFLRLWISFVDFIVFQTVKCKSHNCSLSMCKDKECFRTFNKKWKFIFLLGVPLQVGLFLASPRCVVPPCCGLFTAIPNAKPIKKSRDIATSTSFYNFLCVLTLIYSNPARFNNASAFGSWPLNFLYNSIGNSVPPLESTLSLNFVATSLLKIPFSWK